MRIYTGLIDSQEITTNRDGQNDVRILTVQITEKDDTQTVEQVLFSGEDSAPVKGDEAVILEITESFKVAIGIRKQIAPSMDAGERKLYSQDGNGAIKAFIDLLKDGQMKINGDGDNAVRFQALSDKVDDLVDDLNAMIQEWNTFATAYAPGGPAQVGTPPNANSVTESTVEISGAKIDTIEVPS
jgi:hypothetical protein